MRDLRIFSIGLSLALVFLIGDRTFSQPVPYADIPRMTKEDLRPLLGKPDVVILDVRLEKQWEASDAKIPGAAHLKEEDLQSWAKVQDRSKTYILYCA